VRWGLGAVAALAALALSASAGSDRAQAAPCPAPTIINLAGNLSISGTSPCDSDPENFSVFCGSGNTQFDYYVNTSFVGTFNTGTACAAVARLTVEGRDGDDLIDLSRVSAATGFTGVTLPHILDGGTGADLLVGAKQSNSVLGGPGDDLALIRNGAFDTADCGPDIDAVQADTIVTDTVTSCEIADFLPYSPTGSPNLVPQKKCKKNKKSKKKHHHKHCKKQAVPA
jgi:hypothetical protein